VKLVAALLGPPLVFALISCSKQNHMMVQLAQEASIDGRVFLIINSGDLKPARLASVYVIDTGL